MTLNSPQALPVSGFIGSPIGKVIQEALSMLANKQIREIKIPNNIELFVLICIFKFY